MSTTVRRSAGRPSSTDRETLLDAARGVLRDEGPHALTVRRLTEELGLSRQVVYTHFGSIGGLIDALYREGFIALREAELGIADLPKGIDRVVAGCLAYRASAQARPELYKLMFERPFRDYTPSKESRTFAIAAFQPLVRAIEGTGRTPEEAGRLALSVWAVIHGLVHLELQGYFPRGDAVDERIDEAVRALLHETATATTTTTTDTTTTRPRRPRGDKA